MTKTISSKATVNTAGAGGFLSGAALAVVSYVQKDVTGIISGASVAGASIIGTIAAHVPAILADAKNAQVVLVTEAQKEAARISKIDPAATPEVTAALTAVTRYEGRLDQLETIVHNTATTAAALTPEQLDTIATNAAVKAKELLKASL